MPLVSYHPNALLCYSALGMMLVYTNDVDGSRPRPLSGRSRTPNRRDARGRGEPGAVRPLDGASGASSGLPPRAVVDRPTTSKPIIRVETNRQTDGINGKIRQILPTGTCEFGPGRCASYRLDLRESVPSFYPWSIFRPLNAINRTVAVDGGPGFFYRPETTKTTKTHSCLISFALTARRSQIADRALRASCLCGSPSASFPEAFAHLHASCFDLLGAKPLDFTTTVSERNQVDVPEQRLEPLPYHLDLRDYLKSRERELWDWFASAESQADYTKNLRLALLKSTYRLDADGHPELYLAVEAAKARLVLDIPVTLYQAQDSPQPNATLYFIPGEAHIVFSGSVLTLLNAAELKSVIGHELAHYLLWGRDGGEFHLADRLIQAVAEDPRASSSHEQTARRFRLYTEIFADRGSLHVTGEVDPVVTGLVKIATGLSQVSAQGYLKQAEEIFAQDDLATEGLSHPEAFIRARALALWQERGENATLPITAMIEGALAFEELDLLGQVRLTQATRHLLEQFLQPKWFQTPAVLGQAKRFFHDFQPAARCDTAVFDGLKFTDPKLQEYFCYLLLDFVIADPELDDLPLAAALELSSRLDLDNQFEKLAAKELKLKVRDVRKLKEQATDLLAKTEASGE